jgi:hypothetical protein
MKKLYSLNVFIVYVYVNLGRSMLFNFVIDLKSILWYDRVQVLYTYSKNGKKKDMIEVKYSKSILYNVCITKYARLYKLSNGKKLYYSNGDFDLWPNDPKINTVLPLPQGNNVVKFGKDPIYRTKVIMWKRPWPHDSPVEGEEPYLFWGHYVKGQGHRYYK